MDNTWNTPAWNWDLSTTEEGKKVGKVALFRCQRDPERHKAFAVQISQDEGSFKPSFKPTKILKTPADWDGWLSDVCT